MAFFFSVIGYLIIGFPVSYLLGTILEFGTLGIWIGLLTALTSSAVMLFFRFNYLTNKLIKEKNGVT